MPQTSLKPSQHIDIVCAMDLTSASLVGENCVKDGRSMVILPHLSPSYSLVTVKFYPVVILPSFKFYLPVISLQDVHSKKILLPSATVVTPLNTASISQTYHYTSHPVWGCNTEPYRSSPALWSIGAENHLRIEVCWRGVNERLHKIIGC